MQSPLWSSTIPIRACPPLFYHEVNPGKVNMLVRQFLLGGDPCLEHVMGATVANDMLPSVMDFARFNLEKRVVMEKCGQIDPDDIQDYIATGGYAALAQALCQTPEAAHSRNQRRRVAWARRGRIPHRPQMVPGGRNPQR